MKKLVAIIIGLVLLSFIAAYLFERHDLLSSQRIHKETGLTIPSGTRILGAKADIWSLADGPNYEWLLESPVSWIEWLNAHMKREDSDGVSWRDIKRFSDVAPLAKGPIGTQSLDSV